MELRQLKGRAVVNLGNAERVGSLADLLLDVQQQRAMGVRVALSGLFAGHRLVAWDAIRAVGADALTIESASALRPEDDAHLGPFPLSAAVIGSKVLTEDGEHLGAISDLDLDTDTGAITHYVLGGSFTDRMSGHEQVIAAGNVRRIGEKIVVVAGEEKPEGEG
jgi:sporulation protein YlmC with PRC-barrel domain